MQQLFTTVDRMPYNLETSLNNILQCNHLQFLLSSLLFIFIATEFPTTLLNQQLKKQKAYDQSKISE